VISESMKKTIKKHIGQNIRRVRVYFGIKQETLAIGLGISQQTVSKIEQQKKIEDDLLVKIAGVLGISPGIIKDFEKEEIIYSINDNKLDDNIIIGRKIEGVRRLLRISQTRLGNVLGVTKQAISKMERSKKIENDKIKQVANALGITEAGLKNFNQEAVLYSLHKLKALSPNTYNNIDLSIIELEKTIEFFKKLLQMKRERYHS
jgi:transcriptional regulator with XRE-family HTH domain